MTEFHIFDTADILELTKPIRAFDWFKGVAVSGDEGRDSGMIIPKGTYIFVDDICKTYLRFVVLKENDENLCDEAYPTMFIGNKSDLEKLKIIRSGKAPNPVKPKDPIVDVELSMAGFEWEEPDFPVISPEKYLEFAKLHR